LKYTINIQYRHLNKFKYTQILSNTLNTLKCTRRALNYVVMHYQYDEEHDKYTQMHWKKIQILWCLLKYIYLSLKIHCYIWIYIHIPSKYVIVPSKNLTYFLHILQYHYYTPVSFYIYPYTLKLSWDLSILQLFVLLLTLFFKTVMVLHYSTKMSCICHDIFFEIKKSSIFHKFHTSYWLIK
jgi:phage shock protein PspC (stress-responsive transcriptional regulator)